LKRAPASVTEQEGPVYAIENLKKAVKQVAGTGPSPAAAQVAVRRREPQTTLFKDDGPTIKSFRLSITEAQCA
jgi:hypothetical protein